MNAIWIFVLLILGGGLLGGFANYFMNRTEAGWKKGDILKSLVLGVAAAAVVPLFLQTVQSELMSNCVTGENWYLSCFVFFGFCTLAAIFSARFLTSIADNILKKVDQIEQQQAEIQQTTDAIVALNSDDQGGAAAPLESYLGDDDALESTSRSPAALSPEERLVKTMDSGRFGLRTVNGLVKDTGMDVSAVENMLESLEKRGMVRKMRRNTDGETLWMLNR